MIKIYFAGNKQVFAEVNGFTVKTDQAVRSGGDGAFPEPFTVFLTSLGTCAGIYAKSFCDQRGIETNGMYLSQDQEFDPVRKIIGRVVIKIHVNKEFPDKYDQAIISTVGLCAVKRHLREDIAVEVSVVRE